MVITAPRRHGEILGADRVQLWQNASFATTGFDFVASI